METEFAVKALGALAQSTRLDAFRLLMSSGPDGLPAGQIADALQVPHNTLSSHLATLVQGGLMRSRRESRSILYCVDEDGVRALLHFLLQDCCQGRPELCAPNRKANAKDQSSRAEPRRAVRDRKH